MTMTRIRATALIILAVVALCTATGCGGQTPRPATAPTSIEGKAAVQGRAVTAAGEAVLIAVDGAMDAKTLPAAVGVPIVKAVRDVGALAQQLATTLKVIDTLTDGTQRQFQVEEALAVLTKMQAVLTSSLVPIQSEATRAQSVQLLSGLVSAITQTQTLLNGLRAQ